MIKFIKEKILLLLKYYPDNGTKWIYDNFSEDKPVSIKKTFYFEEDNLYTVEEKDELGYDEDFITFKFGDLVGEYYKINADVLSIDTNLFIYADINITDKMFIAYRNISIFRKINKIVREDIYIGGAKENLPIIVFKDLIASFPNSIELDKYAHARISSILKDYFDKSIDAGYAYEKLMNKRYKYEKGQNLLSYFSYQEFEKYNLILNTLKNMLENEIEYTERQWQSIILEIILLLYPKYIKAFSEVKIKDIYNNKDRRLDYMLVDSNGNIDIIEIKKPFDQSIVSFNKYRDNYIPLKELSGSVMQIEKYIYYLNKWGKSGEEILTENYKSQLPDNFKIKITNPSGIIVMGRQNKLVDAQIEDFEVIKRKYKNVFDIITYDELISRLERMIYKFKLH